MPVHASQRAVAEGNAEAALPRFRRVLVIGTAGSGKTTLARYLAGGLVLRHIELDALHWAADWRPVPRALFRERVAAAAAAPGWVADGNYSAVRDLLWPLADTAIWLDYPLGLVLPRLLRRTVLRIITREELWAGNRERFQSQFLSRESLFLWAWRSARRRRRTYPILFRMPEYAHLRVVRLPTPRATSKWLQTIPKVGVGD